MKIPCYKVDAFAGEVFRGNPAAVCPLEAWLPNATMQSIAAENNLSETAFTVPRGNGFDLRWFTPTVEVDLCGHATLAAALVMFQEWNFAGNAIEFHSRSGILRVSRDGEMLTLDFPVKPGAPCAMPEALVRGLGCSPVEIFKSQDYLAVFKTADEVRTLRPDFAVLKTLEARGIIATAPGEDCDFVSRFFAPAAGIDEDPVTGSAHCTLMPYWVPKLGKAKLFARQISARGGELFCELAGDRVRIGGKAVLYLRGEIVLDDSYSVR
ncbi:MAG TPA: PhzF family phenazine biosynthesis protein [Candidatus Acidoferrales bacterium]|jgi:PhzF family phenazine biosynthesis protein|nr:PhzF family phenazine biosynthesis protein [Candidatus Acidoferrales bacterium]